MLPGTVIDIFNYWANLGREDKRTKLMELLVPLERSVNSSSTRVLSGRNYDLKIFFNLQGYPVCSVAFYFLTSSGHQLIDSLFNRPEKIIKPSVEKATEPTKKELFAEGTNDYVVPYLEVDERYPQYLRFASVPNQTSCIELFQAWLKEKYNTENPLSFCASSTVRQYLADFSQVLWGTDSHCETCSTYELKAKEQPTQKQAIEFNKSRHRNRAKALVNFSSNMASSARHSQRQRSHIYLDYMSIKQLPHPSPSISKQAFLNWKSSYGFAGVKRIHMKCGGLLDSVSGVSSYFFHSHFPESANSILTMIYLHLLNSINNFKQPLTHFSVTLDGHSTGKCLLVLIFFDWLVRIRKLFGENGEVLIIYLMKGHSANLHDQKNVAVTKLFYAMRSHTWLCTPVDAAEVCTDGTKSICTAYSTCWDFEAAFSNSSRNIPFTFAQTHIISFTAAGIKTKEFCDDPWAYENIQLAQEPQLPFNFVEPTDLDEKTKKHLKDFLQQRKGILSENERAYIEEVIQGRIGFENKPFYEEFKPVIEKVIRNRNNNNNNNAQIAMPLDPNGSHQIDSQEELRESKEDNAYSIEDGRDNDEAYQLNNESEEDNMRMINEENRRTKDSSKDEVVVERILTYRTVRASRGDYYLFTVKWKDGDITEEELHTFIDKGEKEEDEIVNNEFLDFEITHPRINFRDTPPPVKKRQKTTSNAINI
jgi:hypothetical protein